MWWIIFSRILKNVKSKFLIFKENLISLMDNIIEKILINLRSDPVLKNHLMVKIDEYKKNWYPPNTGFYYLPTNNPLEFTYELTELVCLDLEGLTMWMHLLSLVITTYYPSYVQGLYSTGLVTKVKETQQTSSHLVSHPQLRAVRSFQMNEWCTGDSWLILAGCFLESMDSVTNLMGRTKVIDAHVQQQHQIHLISTKMHLELCARHCFLKKSQSDKCHVKMPKLCSTQLQVMHFLSPTCNSLQV